MSSLCFWFVYFRLDVVYKVKGGFINKGGQILTKEVKLNFGFWGILNWVRDFKGNGFTGKNVLIDWIKVYV